MGSSSFSPKAACFLALIAAGMTMPTFAFPGGIGLVPSTGRDEDDSSRLQLPGHSGGDGEGLEGSAGQGEGVNELLAAAVKLLGALATATNTEEASASAGTTNLLDAPGRESGLAGRPGAPANAQGPAPPTAPASPMGSIIIPLLFPLLAKIIFSPTMSGRTRGHVYDLYGYMPYGDGYGAGVLNADGAKPWWYSYDETSPYMSQASIGPADFLQTHGPVCPPDCPAEETLDVLAAGREGAPAPSS